METLQSSTSTFPSLTELDARHEEARAKRAQSLAEAIASERNAEDYEPEPALTPQQFAERMVSFGAFVVTTKDGAQYLVPTLDDALEVSEARGGCIDSPSVFKIPGELWGEFRYRQNTKYDTYWREWPEFSEDESEPQRDEPLTADELRALETDGHDAEMLLEGWLPAAGVHPIVGDSGLGKTPLLLQLAACVASGRDFLGIPTTPGNVLICDYENFGSLTTKLMEVSRAIGVDYEAEVKPSVRFLTSPTQDEVFRHAKRTRYALILVDALRGLIGGDDKDGKVIVPTLTRMSKIPSCWCVVHHIRKRDRQSPPPDFTDMSVRVLEWFEEASGHRSIANQTSTRLGIVAPKDGADLFIRAFVKGRGEKGPLLLERIYPAGDPESPIGYRLAQDWSLLPDKVRADYQRVAGRAFAWSELKALLGDHPTRRLVEACQSAQLVTKTGSERQKDRKYIFRALTVETEDQAICYALDNAATEEPEK